MHQALGEAALAVSSALSAPLATAHGKGQSLLQPTSLRVVLTCKYGGDIHCSNLIEVLMSAPDMLCLWCGATPAELHLQ